MHALDGIRVIDQTQVMAGPSCAMLLGDMGADVIKVEPPEGEASRRQGYEVAPGVSAAFVAINRNKRGMTLDLKQSRGVAVLKALVTTADILVENYRPGVAERLGVDYETLKLLNPRLIYCSISGFGQTGPYAARGGYDLIAQGMSGLMSVTGEDGSEPAKSGLPISDLAAGLFGAYGILCALEHRDRTGVGQLVDTSLLEAAMALTVWESAEYWVTGQAPKALGSAHRLAAPYQALQASDGFFTVGANTDKLYQAFCEAIGRADLATDERFRGRAGRLTHRGALVDEIERTTVKEPRTHWLAQIDAAGVPCGPINTYPEALADPHALARGMVVDLLHPGAGEIKALGVPVKLSETPGAVDRPAPLVGQHTAELQHELGYDATAQQTLRAAGVV